MIQRTCTDFNRRLQQKLVTRMLQKRLWSSHLNVLHMSTIASKQKCKPVKKDKHILIKHVGIICQEYYGNSPFESCATRPWQHRLCSCVCVCDAHTSFFVLRKILASGAKPVTWSLIGQSRASSSHSILSSLLRRSQQSRLYMYSCI